MRIGGQLVTTVLDLMLAQYGVGRDGLPGEWPSGYDDADQVGTPAWQELITSVDRGDCVRTAREFARNAEQTEGRSMIAMGAGTNHWFHSDEIYRTFLAMVLLCGCQGKNGGGWAHYVGQEKVRPLTGFQTVAFASDWVRPPRHQAATPFFSLLSGQWRYADVFPDRLASPLGTGRVQGHAHRRHERARRPARLAAVVPELRPQHPRPGRRGRAGGRRPGRRHVVSELRGTAAVRLRGP